MILSEQREGHGHDPDRGSPSSAGEGEGDSRLGRPTPNRPRRKRVWKSHHERQVLLTKYRQRSRAVCGESGDNHRRLPDVNGRTAGVAAVVAAQNQPCAVRFNREGVELTTDSLGANGCFIDVYNRDDDRKGTRGKYRKPKRRPHPCPCIGPGTHSLDYGQVANVYEERLFAESEGAETSVSRYLKDKDRRMVRDGVGRRRGSEEASGSGYGGTVGDGPHGDEEGVFGQSCGKCENASLYGSGGDGESIYSVLSFEDLYAKTTQVTDALATVEHARGSEPVKPSPSRRPRAAANRGGGGRVDGDWKEQQRRARAASRSETARFVYGRQGP